MNARCRNTCLLFLLSFFTLLNRAFAQQTYSLKGTVGDSVSAAPLGQATLTLYRLPEKTPFKQLQTSAQGDFSIAGLPSGNYRLLITTVGYISQTRESLRLAADMDLGTIRLVPTVSNLKEVTVNSTVPLVEQKIDRLVYNAAADQTATTGDATDVLRKVPMVAVDGNGNVALRGNRNVRILIDGKASGAGAGNSGDLLQSIPAGQVKSIEVMTSPSAKYDAEGSGGVINIITRKKTIEGINGSVATGMGTRQWTANGSVNARLGKLSLSANAGISNKWPRDIGIDAYTYNNKGDSSVSKGHSINSRISNNAYMTLQYDFNELNSLSSTFRRSEWGYDDDLQVQSTSKTPQSTQTYGQTLTGKVRSSGFDWSSDYLHRFKKKGEELDFALQWSNNSSTQDYNSRYTGFFANQQAENKGRNNEYTLQLDYTLPITDRFKLETGGKSVFRRITSTSDYTDGSSPDIYNYRQQVYAAYFVLNFKLKQGWEIQAGNRLEVTGISGHPENGQPAPEPFDNRYVSDVPSLILQKKLGDQRSVKFSYSKRIQRPSLQYLNPFRNASDPLNQTEGNPALSPEQDQTLELTYSSSTNKSNFSAGFYYKMTDRLIEGYATSDQGAVTLTRFGNIGSNRSLGTDLYGSWNITQAWRVRASLDLYTYHPQVDPAYQVYLNAGTFLQYNGFAGTTYQLSPGTTVEANYSFQSRYRTFQGTTANLNTLNIGARKEFFQGKASVGIVAVNPFRDKWDFGSRINTPELVQVRSLMTPFRSFNLNLSYKFGGKALKSLQSRGVNNNDLKP